MNLVLVGVNHRSAPLEVRERLFFPADSIVEALRRLDALPEVGEGFLLSTCNRTELLVHMETSGKGALAILKGFLARERAFSTAELDRHLYIHRNEDAVQHLFRLGVGLDSMILGEPQILGQVKEAYRTSLEAGSLGSILGDLFQRAFAVAKNIRTTSEIGRSPVSVSFAAVRLAQQIFGDLDRKSILILGAGKTAELTARHLVSHGIRSIFVANRTYRRAQELARAFDGKAVPYDRFFECLEHVDIVISSTSAPHPVVGYEDALGVIRRRRNRPLFFIDIAVPRNVDPSVNRIDNLYLYDIDDLQKVADTGLEERRLKAKEAERMVAREVEAYVASCRTREIAPTIVALREKLDGLRESEMTRFRGRLERLAPDDRRAVEDLTSSLINKILHGPIRHLKRATASPDGAGLIDVIRQVFGLAGSAREERSPGSSGPAESTGREEESLKETIR